MSSWRSTIRNGRVPRVRTFRRPSSMRSSTSAISQAQPIPFVPASVSQTMPNSPSFSSSSSNMIR